MHQKKSFRSNPDDLSYAISCRFTAPKLSVEEFFHIKRLFAFEHKVDRTAKFMGKNLQRLALVVLMRKLGHIVFRLG
jgi:hypothetical protein